MAASSNYYSSQFVLSHLVAFVDKGKKLLHFWQTGLGVRISNTLLPSKFHMESLTQNLLHFHKVICTHSSGATHSSAYANCTF